LIASFDHGGASAAIVIPLIFELAKNVRPDSSSTDQPKQGYQLDPAQYNSLILTPVVKLYARPDRGTRMALLEALPEYEGQLDGKMVQDTIWPHFQTGFADTVPVIREATVKAVSVLAPKFSSRILNNDLLRHLAKAQSDPEPSIRTNTCILIARLAPSLSTNTKKKVLMPAFSKALKDPFVHARVAGVMGVMACVDSFDIEDAATKVIGLVGSGLIDKEKIVRDPAFKCLEMYRAKIHAYAETLPETALLPDGTAPPSTSITSYTGQASTDILSAATGVAGGVAGWALESISSRLVSRDQQPTTTTKIGGTLSNSTTSAPVTPGLLSSPNEPKVVVPSPSPVSSVRSVPSSSSSKPPAATGGKSKGKGMALGGSKTGAKGGHAALMAELEKEMQKEEMEVADAWGEEEEKEEEDKDNPFYGAVTPTNERQTEFGGGDLMDVNADQDDWTPFESASPGKANSTAKPLGSMIQAENPWKDSADDLAAAFSKPATYASVQTTYSTTPLAAPSIAQAPIAAASPKPVDDWGASDMVAVDNTHKVESPSKSAASSSGAGMSKEEKAAELARRREERKARIAQLKEQKKGGM
ncbi:hypothetical protein FRC17_002172, partial [Serendipita sp. 399]